jgi:hypothetical protein
MEAIVSMRLDPYHALVRAEETAGTLDRDKMRMVLTVISEMDHRTAPQFRQVRVCQRSVTSPGHQEG